MGLIKRKIFYRDQSIIKPGKQWLNTIPLLQRISLSQLVIFNLFFMSMLFSVYLLTQFPIFYEIIKALFILEGILLIIQVSKIVRKQPIIILCILLVFAIRLPFLMHSDGLIITSDNALEALQVQDIQEKKTVPFFLFESSGHSGTYRYLFVAYFWDFFGKDYLYLVLFQLLMFLALLFILYEIFKPIVDEKILLLFFISSYAFIEVVFDYSLFLRGGRYLEMFLFFLLGVYLFDFTFKNKTRVFLSFYFLFFAIYLQPFGILFVVPFVLTALIYLIKKPYVLKNLAPMILGGCVGLYHLFYYKIVLEPPPLKGGWFEWKLISKSHLKSLKHFSMYCVKTIKNVVDAFENVLGYQFQYSMDYFKGIRIMELSLTLVNRIFIYFSFFIFLVVLILVIKRLLSIIKSGLVKNDWLYIFFCFSFLSVIGKHLIIGRRLMAPRRNLDITFLIIISFLLFFSSFLKVKRLNSFKSLAVILLLFIFTIPHYHTFLKGVIFKERSYHEILTVLEENGVKYLTTDFIIAYPLYFLSDKEITVTASLGPLKIWHFLPELRKTVDRLPIDEKAYLLFSDNTKRKRRHVQRTKVIRRELLRELRQKKIKFRICKLEYYTIIIPKNSRMLNRK